MFLALLALVAILAPLISSYDPTATRLADVLAPPFTPEHPLGADGVGRDVLANLVYGAQTSLSSAAIVIAVSLLIGVPTGSWQATAKGGSMVSACGSAVLSFHCRQSLCSL